MLTNIPIETSMLKLLMQGKKLILIENKDRYKKGDVLGVKETFRFDKTGIHYAADENVQVGEYEYNNYKHWTVCNMMKPEYIKRYIQVVNKDEIKSSSLKDKLPFIKLYNKKVWLLPDDVNNFQTIYNSRTTNIKLNENVYIFEFKLLDKTPIM